MSFRGLGGYKVKQVIVIGGNGLNELMLMQVIGEEVVGDVRCAVFVVTAH